MQSSSWKWPLFASDLCACILATVGLSAHFHQDDPAMHFHLSLVLNSLLCSPGTNLPSLLINWCPWGKARGVFHHPVRPKHLLQTPVPFSSKTSSPTPGDWRALLSRAVQSCAVGKHTHKPVSIQMSQAHLQRGNALVKPWWKKPICTFTATNARGDRAGKEGPTPAFSLMQSHCCHCAWWAAPGSSSHMEGKSSTTSNGCTRLSNRKSPSSFSYVHFWKMTWLWHQNQTRLCFSAWRL